jgi:hypothetical protein
MNQLLSIRDDSPSLMLPVFELEVTLRIILGYRAPPRDETPRVMKHLEHQTRCST